MDNSAETAVAPAVVPAAVPVVMPAAVPAAAAVTPPRRPTSGRRGLTTTPARVTRSMTGKGTSYTDDIYKELKRDEQKNNLDTTW